MIVAPAKHIALSSAAIVAMVVTACLVAMALGPASERILTVFFVSLVAVIGMGVYSGNSGILSFGHVAFMGIGAYASALLTLPANLKSATLPGLPGWLAGIELSLWPSVAIAVLLTCAVALVVGLAIGRLEGAAATIATLGLLIIVHGITIGWRDVTRGAQTFFGVPRETTVLVAGVGCILALLAARLYRDSVSGLRLRAGRENAIAAGAVGIKVRRERQVAWVLSAALMALSGALLAHFLGAFSPKKFFFVDTFFLLSMLIVGGMTTITGAISGTVVVTLSAELLRRLESGFAFGEFEIPPIFGTTQIGIAVIILVAMFRKSEGIAGLLEWEERLVPARAVAIPKGDPTPRESSGPSLACHDLSISFGGLLALNQVSLSARPGEILGLIGPNGSGKTTLLNIISGLLKPDAGEVRLGEENLVGLASADFAQRGLARTFQNIRLFANLTIEQNVLAAALSTADGKDAAGRTWHAISRLGLAERAGERAGALSYGEQRRVEIARALACGPSLLFLDEPAAGMNEEETADLMRILRGLVAEQGLGIVIVDHDLHLINQLCDRVAVLNEGRLIAEGTTQEIRSNPAVVEAYFGRNRGEVTNPQTNRKDVT